MIKKLSLLLLALLFATNAYAVTEYIVTVKPSGQGGDYTSLEAACNGNEANLTTSNVINGSLTRGAISGAITQTTTGATATVISKTSTQMLVGAITGSPNSSDTWYPTADGNDTTNCWTPTTAGDSVQFTIKIDGTWSSADTSAVTIHNYTTDATRYINIYTTSAARHQGVYSTSKYSLEPNADYSLVCYVDYITITGVQGYTDAKTAIFYDGGGTARTLSKILTKGSTTYHCYGWNNIINSIGYGTASNFARGSTNVYSCTAVGMSIPYRAITTAKNCYGGNNTGGYDFYDVTNMTTCASSDNTGTVGLRTIAVNTTNFTNVTGGSENFHLPLGSALIDVGTNTSGDSAPLNFTDDIDGVTRSGTWDIGADEYVATSSSSIKTINGLLKASVKTFNGLAIGSVKSINGLQ